MQLPFPVVNISSWLEDPGVPTVRVDWCKLGRMAAEHLLENGFRRFGCVIVPGGRHVQQRFSAFADTVRRHGFNVNIFHLRTTQPEFTQPLAERKRVRFKEWLRQLQPPTALALTDDWDAPTLMDPCREIGLEIPRDPVVISTGIHSEVLPLCRPALTGAQEDLQQQAMMAGKKSGTRTHQCPPARRH